MLRCRLERGGTLFFIYLMPINSKCLVGSFYLRDTMDIKSCCFIGHRKIENADQVKEKLTAVISQLIGQGVTVFYFGSRSEFDDLAWEVVTELKETHQDIKRIYIRSAYAYIPYLLVPVTPAQVQQPIHTPTLSTAAMLWQHRPLIVCSAVLRERKQPIRRL